ncbi:hypothetical protein EOPP23_09300 [Endozoicomonas sp. OPT23]|uniref:hypothetical protein n=1 Tax=Endozoicomonas sp. OPT23 TaxID=2072845 RepID=UPI00129B7275|nr:hypothetical protein [Endozoicomonas sp. OPT23]MRI33178.1 hypothetical protein [Endozoicomonas sp. OPT23]
MNNSSFVIALIATLGIFLLVTADSKEQKQAEAILEERKLAQEAMEEMKSHYTGKALQTQVLTQLMPYKMAMKEYAMIHGTPPRRMDDLEQLRGLNYRSDVISKVALKDGVVVARMIDDHWIALRMSMDGLSSSPRINWSCESDVEDFAGYQPACRQRKASAYDKVLSRAS